MDYKKHAEDIKNLEGKYIKRYGKDKDYSRVKQLIEKCCLLCNLIADNMDVDPKKAVVAIMEFQLPWNQLEIIFIRKRNTACQ